MAAQNRSTLTFNGTKLPCISSRVRFKTASDHKGDPAPGSFETQIRCWMDVHNNKQIQNSQIQSLFTAANVVDRSKIYETKIEFWEDDKGDNALCAYSFKGWIEKLQIVNPLKSDDNGTHKSGGVNHLLVVDLVVALDTQNASALTIGN